MNRGEWEGLPIQGNWFGFGKSARRMMKRENGYELSGSNLTK